jgi:hypothetical protein
MWLVAAGCGKSDGSREELLQQNAYGVLLPLPQQVK